MQPLTFTAVLDTLPVTGWQVVHEETGEMTVLLSGVPDGFTEQTVVEPIKQALTAQGVRLPSITVKPAAAIPRTGAGKAPLIRSDHPAGKAAREIR